MLLRTHSRLEHGIASEVELTLVRIWFDHVVRHLATFDAQTRQLPRELRQRGEQHFADGMVVVLGRPAQQREQFVIEDRPGVEDLLDALQSGALEAGIGGALEHDADALAPAEGHEDARPGPRCGIPGEVIERPAQRRVHRDAYNGGVVQ